MTLGLLWSQLEKWSVFSDELLRNLNFPVYLKRKVKKFYIIKADSFHPNLLI